jgi:UDP-N-acetylglucosamine--N-acetylmuramyl-(pentapeptide) pyrophosphoryl-undecaprenol N-acetylglucosamine transferase
MKNKSIVFSGGGSGGHSVVAQTLISYFRDQGILDISYIGGYKGLEKDLCEKNNIPYFAVSTGKLRRYLSLENFFDFFRFLNGVIQSIVLFLFKLRKTDIVFVTGGHVCLPVAIAGFLLRKKVFLHEQTTRAGLANRIAAKFADKVFISFKSSEIFFDKNKIQFSGYPLRSEFLNKEVQNKKILGVALKSTKILLFLGGGNGSKIINDFVKENLTELTSNFFVFHQTGKRFIDEFKGIQNNNYRAFDFLGRELVDLIKSSELIVCRAGAGTVCELMALNKKTIFIPLKIAQKNEQYHNAKEASEKIGAKVLEEDQFFKLKETIFSFDKEKLSFEKSVHSQDARQIIFQFVFKQI